MMQRSLSIVFVVLALFLVSSCGDKSTSVNPDLPRIVAKGVIQIDICLPTVEFTLESAGASAVSMVAICWGESPRPDLSGDHYNFGPASDELPDNFGKTLWGLTPGTKYYARAYAKNAHGEVWSDQISFTTLPLVWNKVDSGVSNDLTRIHFVDANTGWICGESGMLLKTINGGNSWTVVPSGATQRLTDMHWMNPDTGWICGGNRTLRKTINGGNSWLGVSVPGSEDQWFTNIYFETPQIGYLLCDSGWVFKTTDGGANWQPFRTLNSYNSYHDIWSSGNTVMIVGEGARITRDGGETWYYALNSDHEYFQIYLDSQNLLWVAGGNDGSGGIVYKSEDLTGTWSTAYYASTWYRFTSITKAPEPHTNRMWLAGANSVIRASNNGGEDWHYNNDISSCNFNHVYAYDVDNVWIVGDYGYIYKRIPDSSKQ